LRPRRARAALRRPPEGEILGPLRQGEEVRRVSGGSRGSGSDRAMGGPEPALRGGGLPLPGLKHWRLRRGFSQTELARRAELKDGYVARIESGRRGCNPETAQLLADLLEADLRDLRTNHDDAPEAGAPPKPSRPRIAYRNVHQAYLKIILEGAVGSAYAAMEEWEIEKRCEKSTWEGVLEAVRARGREIGFLVETVEARGLLRDPELPEEVRSFLKATIESRPDLDIRLLAAARRRETSERGREALTEAMRGLL
jgi:transcriptional regulator with XRE-family HTH domain